MAPSLAIICSVCFFIINTSSLNQTLSPDQEYFYNTTVSGSNVTEFEDASEVPVQNNTEAPTEPSGAGGPNISADPLPVSGQLPSPAVDVRNVCPCDKHRDVCDINCCCDRACGEQLSLFTRCSVSSVRGSRQLCSQEVALYSLRTTIDGYSELQSAVQTENNQDLFCIHSQNRVDSLSHHPPVLPTERYFDSIFHQFSDRLFGQQQVGPLESAAQLEETSGYQLGDVILTIENTGQRRKFHLPSSGVSADCVDTSPAGFMVEQSSRCSRRFSLEQDCISLPALSMDTFTNIQLSAGKSEDAPVVDVEVDSLVVQYPGGIQKELGVELLSPALFNTTVCVNVVQKVVYVVTYSPSGEVVNASVSVKLGFVSAHQLPLQQHFHMTFVQEGNENVDVTFSGSPGYQAGLPLVSAKTTAEGLTRSVNPEDTLSLLQPGQEQDCLQGPHQYSPVLFGLDFISGCTLSTLVDVANCSMLSEMILEALRGHNYPQYVASFGNSLLDNPLDWVPIRSSNIPAESEGCSIPLSLHFEIEWTKYGSLMNPQVQIVSVKELIYTNTSSLRLLSGGSDVLSIKSSVSFVPVSAAARAGYRATPTIDAKLPVDFFFPFV